MELSLVGDLDLLLRICSPQPKGKINKTLRTENWSFYKPTESCPGVDTPEPPIIFNIKTYRGLIM